MAYSHVLDDDERKELLRIARTTVKEYLVSGRMPPGAPHKTSLTTPAAVFVSLHDGEVLRGCIGTTHEIAPIYKAVQEMAVAAASRDPRFPAVRLDELNRLSIEISVLGEHSRFTRAAELVVGIHGVQVSDARGGHPRRGLLLPRVAVDHGWDAETFLAHTCEKAGLDADFWRQHPEAVELFSAQAFDERALRTGPFAERP